MKTKKKQKLPLIVRDKKPPAAPPTLSSQPEERAKVTALAPWFGSNRTLAETVGKAFKGCNWVGVPFAGGMTELLHIKANSIIVGDKHAHIINLAKVVADPKEGPRLYRRLRRVFFADSVLQQAQDAALALEEALERNKEQDKIHPDAAFAYFIAVWMGRSANAGTTTEFKGNLAARWKAGGGDSAVRYFSAVEGLRVWQRVCRRCTFLRMDCFEFLEKCHDIAKNGLYCDPPWPKDGERYWHGFTKEQHIRLEGRLREFKRMRVVVRFGDHPLIRKLYREKHWEWRFQNSRTQANKTKAEMLLVRNDAS